jgi:endonuclease YncB( thermonuclease family)
VLSPSEFLEIKHGCTQAEYFGATLDQTMKAGKKATDVARQTLQAPFTVWTRWGNAGGRSKERRYYALVQVNHRWLDEMLVSKGLARGKGVRPNLPNGQNWREHADRLDALEAEAKKQRLGAWGQVDTGKETVRGEARG